MITRSMKRRFLSLSCTRYRKEKKMDTKRENGKGKKPGGKEENSISHPPRVPLDRSNRTIPSSATKARHAASRIRSVWPVWPFGTSSARRARVPFATGIISGRASISSFRRNVVGFSCRAWLATRALTNESRCRL